MKHAHTRTAQKCTAPRTPTEQTHGMGSGGPAKTAAATAATQGHSHDPRWEIHGSGCLETQDTQCIRPSFGYTRIHTLDTLRRRRRLTAPEGDPRRPKVPHASPHRGQTRSYTAMKRCMGAVQLRMQDAGWSADVERWESDEDTVTSLGMSGTVT